MDAKQTSKTINVLIIHLDSSRQVGDQFLISGSPKTTFCRIGEWASGNLQPCYYMYDKARNTPYLRHDTWGTDLVFIVDLNATIRRGFTNITIDYQKLRLEIGVGIDRQYETWQIEISVRDPKKFMTRD